MSDLLKIIPDDHDIARFFRDIAESARLVVFSGLPGVGKSLYIKEFTRIALELGRDIDLIQWDVARKAFETEFIMRHFPMQGSTVHNGLKLAAGKWLMQYVFEWNRKAASTASLLLIEAPLVGHRFAELVHQNQDEELEQFLASEACRIIVPIPTKRLRKHIEDERARQVSEDAKDWSGAKPSVMLQLWKDTCEIANFFGMDISLEGQPPYSDGIYEYVYSVILKNRHFEALIIDELFNVPVEDESFLHSNDSISPHSEEADQCAAYILENLDNQSIDKIVSNWYKT